jgi:N6-adenosine-specific RNA methylase IME4
MGEEMRYKTILADPPWKWEAYSAKGDGRSAFQHYPTKTMNQLFVMRDLLSGWAYKDSVLLLWAIGSMLPHAMELMKVWGFKFKTVAFVWVKINRHGSPLIGLGYWTRQNAEYCLLGTRGHPKPIWRDVPQVILSHRREHSRKPDDQYERIERLVSGPYLELFARQTYPGWIAWGNEIHKFDEGGSFSPNPSKGVIYHAPRQIYVKISISSKNY